MPTFKLIEYDGLKSDGIPRAQCPRCRHYYRREQWINPSEACDICTGTPNPEFTTAKSDGKATSTDWMGWGGGRRD